jgi:hypothetical protein
MPCSKLEVSTAQHGTLSGAGYLHQSLHDVLRSAHGRGRIQWDDLAGDEPIEQHPHGGELLLHVRRRMRLLAGFNVARHVDGSDRHQREAALIAPGEKLLACARIGSSRVRVADVGGEELHIAPSRLVAGVGDQRRRVSSEAASAPGRMIAGSWSEVISPS